MQNQIRETSVWNEIRQRGRLFSLLLRGLDTCVWKRRALDKEATKNRMKHAMTKQLGSATTTVIKRVGPTTHLRLLLFTIAAMVLTTPIFAQASPWENAVN